MAWSRALSRPVRALMAAALAWIACPVALSADLVVRLQDREGGALEGVGVSLVRVGAVPSSASAPAPIAAGAPSGPAAR